ncbi:YncE family protein [Granulicella sp. L46]|jgi:DNA-binding beta-propeller fold protein YncE|uniref:YncE family protein n=1 Tax=Granulicella sp. L46 TaxID=1641865 RepID=UPI00131AD92F|nr:YncE family protein [Granulicella sp. L46]
MQFVRVLSANLALSAFLIGSAAMATKTSTPTAPRVFHVEEQWNIGGKGGWGFLAIDPAAHRLFIPRTDHISVVDIETGKVLGEIAGMVNLRNLALDDDGRYGYATDVTDGNAGFVRVFDRTSLQLVASIPTAPVPFAIVYDQATRHVFAFSSRGHSVDVIDSSTNRVISTLPLAGRPGFAVDDGKGTLFVALPARGMIQRIDAASHEVTASWPLGPCTGPSNLAIDIQHHQLFSSCEDHSLISVDTTTGKVDRVGEATENAGDLDFDPRLNMLFMADSTGSLTVYHRESPLHYTKLQNIKTASGARTMVVDHENGKAYLVTSKYGLNSGNVSEELRYRPTPIPGTFSVIVVSR